MGRLTIFNIFDPPHCGICHDTWWIGEFDYINWQPVNAPTCPSCHHDDWDDPIVRNLNFDKRDSADWVTAYCPRCDFDIVVRKTWLKKQRKLDKKGKKAKVLPFVIKPGDNVIEVPLEVKYLTKKRSSG